MRSVVLDFANRQLVENDLPEPAILSPSAVRFRIHEVGVCGTDRELAAFRIRFRVRDTMQIIIGHEALGQVEECGPAVTTLAPGDWVVPTIRRGCRPPCSACARGRSDLCGTGRYAERGIFNLDGYFTEFAVDEAADLIRIPAELAPYAVLLEPLSVVEKSMERIEQVRQSDGRDALVLGLGPVGILMALVLRLRGYNVTLYSAEADDHPRIEILDTAGVRYTRALNANYDLIVEAAGSAELVFSAIKHLAPCGIFLTLGAQRATAEFSFIDMIVGNHTLIGAVNASRTAFEAGARDMAAIPQGALRKMIRRFGFSDYPQTLAGLPSAEPKIVHVIANSLH